MSLTLKTLGPIRLERLGEPILPRRKKELTLLAYLARRTPPESTRTTLATLFWGDRDDRHARQSLRQALLILRQGTSEAVEVDGEVVRIRTGAVELDAARFEAELAAGRQAEALGRWEGDFLAGQEEAGTEEFRTWVQGERARLRHQMMSAFDQVVHQAQERGDWGGALVHAERWCHWAPFEEPAELRRIECLRLAGRASEASARHAAYVTFLRDELGGSPSPAFAEMGAHLVTDVRTTAVASSGLLSPDFVGREEAFSTLTEAWRGMSAKAGAVVLVEGSSGLGKSRLLRELQTFVQEKSPRSIVLHGRGYESERASPLETLRHLLAPLLSAPGIRAAPGATLAVLAEVLPELRERIPGLPAAAAGASVADAVARALMEVGAESPCLVACDDVGSADPASLDVLASLIRRPPPGVLIVLTARPDTLEGASLARDLRQRAETHHVRLGTLSLRDVERLVQSMLPLDPSLLMTLAAALQEASGGNPGQIVGLLGLLADEGIVEPDRRGIWQLTRPLTAQTLPLPADLREAVRVRLDRLPEDARRVLESAAVLGSPFSTDEVESLAGVTPGAGASGLGVLLSRAWVRNAHPGAYDFTSEGTRRAVYDLMPRAVQRRLHRAAYQRLRSRKDADPARLSYHRHLGGGRMARGWQAVAALSILVATVVAVGWWSRTPPAAAADPDTIALAVLPFTGAGPASSSSITLKITDLVTESLSDAGNILLLDPALVAEAIKAAPDPVPVAEARAAAHRLGADIILRGRTLINDGDLILTAELFGAEGSNAFAVLRVAGPRTKLDSLSNALATSILSTIAARLYDRPSGGSAPGTESLVALKAYLRAEQSYRAGNLVGAANQWNEAVAADSEFTRAWFRLSQVADWTGDGDRALEAMQRAIALGGRVDVTERRMYAGFNAFLLGEFARSDSILRNALGHAPWDVDARVALGETLLHGNWTRGRSMVEAEPQFIDALRRRPDEFTARRHAGDLAYRRGDIRRGDSLYAAFFSLMSVWYPGSRTHLSALQAFAAGDARRERIVLDSLATGPERVAVTSAWIMALYHPVPADISQSIATLTRSDRSPEGQGLGHSVLAYLALAGSDTASAREHLSAAADASPLEAMVLSGYLALTDKLTLPPDTRTGLEAQLLAWAPQAGPAPGRLLPETVLGVIGPTAREYLLALAALGRNDLTGVEAAARRLETTPVTLRAFEPSLARSLRAHLALAHGDTARAITLLESAWTGIQFESGRASPLVSRPADRVLMGDLLARTGRREEARGWYQSISELSPWDLAWLPEAQRGLTAVERSSR